MLRPIGNKDTGKCPGCGGQIYWTTWANDKYMSCGELRIYCPTCEIYVVDEVEGNGITDPVAWDKLFDKLMNLFHSQVETMPKREPIPSNHFGRFFIFGDSAPADPYDMLAQLPAPAFNIPLGGIELDRFGAIYGMHRNPLRDRYENDEEFRARIITFPCTYYLTKRNITRDI
jgi:hypothetical protein